MIMSSYNNNEMRKKQRFSKGESLLFVWNFRFQLNLGNVQVGGLSIEVTRNNLCTNDTVIIEPVEN